MDNQNIIPFRQSIRARWLTLLLGLTILSIVVIAYFSINAILRSGERAQAVGNEVLRQQAEEFLVQLTIANAQAREVGIEDIRQGADHIARFAASIFDAQSAYDMQTLWLADEKMFVGPDGQFINGEEDITSVYVPNTVEIDEALLADIELSSYLDRLIPGIYESDANIVAIYMIHKKDFTRIYPNINLGMIVPPDFSATGDIFFTLGAPENNPEKESVWTPIYDDPAGQGLLVTAVSPVYTSQGEFVGTIGIDVSLAELTTEIENEQLITGGYSFLINQDGVTIALPKQGYEDIFETSKDSETPTEGVDLSDLSTPFAPVLTGMQNGETGFQAINANGKDLFVAYAPIAGTGWSMASVVEAENMLQVTNILQQEVESSTQSLVRSSILPVSVVIVVIAVLVSFIFTTRLTEPIRQLVLVARQIGSGNWDSETTSKLESMGKSEIGVLANTFKMMTDQLREVIDNLEQRVAERTQDLTLAVETGRRISQVRDKDKDALLAETVTLIRDRFNLYHVQIFLVDTEGNNLVLHAGTGEAGRQMSADTFQLPIDGLSLSSQAFLEKQTIFVADTSASDIYQSHSLFPDTCSEAVIPLMVGDRVVGVLDLQSTESEMFSEESLPALETLAGQLAVAIDNAVLFAERQQAAEALIPFRQGFEQSPSALFLTDIEGVITYVNPAFSNLYGFSAEEALSQTPRILKSGLISQEEYEKFWQMLLNKQIVAGEKVNKARDGRYILIADINSPIVSEAGEIIGFLSLHTDISERKAAEDKLARRVAELNCLNDIGRKVEDALPVPEFMEWVMARISTIFSHTESFMNAVMIGDQVYGVDTAISQKRHIVEGLYIGSELIGKLYFAYADETLSFGDEDSAFIGAIGGRLSSYVESRNLLQRLEQQAAEMAQQATELQQVAEIGTAVATILDPQQLMQTFVDMTKSRFDLYHVHIYLFDQETKMLQLAAGAGEVGQKMVAEGRQIPLHQQQSLVAQAARSHQGVIVNDVLNEPGFLPHPLLPDTHAEMAVPLIVFDQLLGILDVQVDEVEAFSEADVSIFTTLATQVAVALQNANQYQETQQTLQEVSALQQAMTRQGWQRYLTAKERPVYGYLAQQSQVNPITIAAQSPEIDAVPLQEICRDETAVITPIRLGETSIGSLGVRQLADNPLSEEQQALLEAISEQVGQALERARLFEETEIARSQTETLYAGSDQVVRAMTMEDVLMAVVNSTRLKQFGRTRLMLFDRPWGEQPPENLTAVAVHEPEKVAAEDSLSGNQFPLKRIPYSHLLMRDTPFIVEDILTDKRADEKMRHFFQKETGMRSLIIFSLVAGDEWIGLLAADHPLPMPLTEDETRQISSLTDQAATVIQSLRLYAAAEERAAELAIINRVVSTVSGTLELKDSLQKVADELARVVEEEQIAIALFNEAQNNLTVVAESYDPEKAGSSMGFVIPVEGNLLTQEVLETRKTVMVEDAQNDPRTEPVHDGMKIRGVHTLYVIPMIAGNTIVGTVGIDIMEKGRVLTERQLGLAETIVYQAATAVQNSRLYTETQLRADELALINTVSEVASSQLDLDAIFTSVGTLLQETFEADAVYFALYDAHTQKITFPYFFSHKDGKLDEVPRTLENGGLTAEIIKSRKPRLLLWQADDAKQFAEEAGANIVGGGRMSDEYIGVPMIVGKEIIGVMAINGYQNIRTFTEEDRQLMETLSGTIGVAVQNARQYDATRRRAEREMLINTIGQKIQSAPTVQSALQTAVSELGQALKLRKAIVELSAANQTRTTEEEPDVEFEGNGTHS